MISLSLIAIQPTPANLYPSESSFALVEVGLAIAITPKLTLIIPQDLFDYDDFNLDDTWVPPKSENLPKT